MNKPDNLIIAFNYKPDGKTYNPMLTVGRIDHEKDKMRVISNFTGDEAVKIYNTLIGKERK